nr:hypothetical protein Q903MT_gene4583 [Picea sitchensis]
MKTTYDMNTTYHSRCIVLPTPEKKDPLVHPLPCNSIVCRPAFPHFMLATFSPIYFL